MNSKKGLSRIMSALLAASSMIGGASAGKKKVGKRRPGNAGVIVNEGGNRLSPSRGESAPTLLKNPKTYYFGVPCLIATAIVGYGLCRYFSGGEKGDVYKTGDDFGREILSKWGLGKFTNILSSFPFRVLNNEKFGRLVCIDGRLTRADGRICFQLYFKIDDEKDIIKSLCGVWCCFYALSNIFLDETKFATGHDALKFFSEKCSGSKVGENFTNIVEGNLLSPSNYFKYLCGKANIDYSQKESLFEAACNSYSGRFDQLHDALAENEKEIYVSEKDGGVYLRNIKKKQ